VSNEMQSGDLVYSYGLVSSTVNRVSLVVLYHITFFINTGNMIFVQNLAPFN
jgi:hypothetical protein